MHTKKIIKPKLRHSVSTMRHSFTRGFTFVETIVAIAVLLVSVVAPLSLAAQGLRTARIARDQVVVNYLAQEAIEFVRFQRDGSALQNSDWLAAFPPECFDGECVVDIPNNTIESCGSNKCSFLQFDSVTGRYGYDSDWEDTKFSRIVTFSYGDNSDREIGVTVTLTWSDVFVTRSFTLKEQLFNWQ